VESVTNRFRKLDSKGWR